MISFIWEKWNRLLADECIGTALERVGRQGRAISPRVTLGRRKGEKKPFCLNIIMSQKQRKCFKKVALADWSASHTRSVHRLDPQVMV